MRFFLIACCFFFTSCSQSKPASNWMEGNGKVKVLSTTSQIGDLVVFIGGERVDSITLIPSGLDPHSYELVKGDGEKVACADLIFYNGLGLEHGASLSALLHKSPKAVALGESIRTQVPHLILEREGVVDPHIWMDLSLWSQGIPEIVRQLSEIDPPFSTYYQERGEQLQQQILEKDRFLRALLATIPSDRRYLVTSHDAFRYFARAYLREPGESNWEERFTAPEGLAPDGQLSPVDMQAVILFLQGHQIGVLFPESNLSQGVIAKIAEVSSKMGHPVRLCSQPLYGDSTSGLPYLEAMEKNGERIAKELGAP